MSIKYNDSTWASFLANDKGLSEDEIAKKLLTEEWKDDMEFFEYQIKQVFENDDEEEE